MVSQQLIIQCNVCSGLFTYQTNLNISRTKSDVVPLSFQEFFQIRQTSFSFHIHFKDLQKTFKDFKDCYPEGIGARKRHN